MRFSLAHQVGVQTRCAGREIDYPDDHAHIFTVFGGVELLGLGQFAAQGEEQVGAHEEEEDVLGDAAGRQDGDESGGPGNVLDGGDAAGGVLVEEDEEDEGESETGKPEEKETGEKAKE